MRFITRLDPFTFLGLALVEAARAVLPRQRRLRATAGHLVLGITNITHHQRQWGDDYLHLLTFGGLFARVWEVALSWQKKGPGQWEPTAGIRLEEVPIHERHGPYGRRTAALQRLIRLRRELELAIGREEYGVLTAHDPHLLGLLAVAIKRRTGIPFVLHLNSNFDNKFRQTGKVSFTWLRWRWLERLVEHFVMAQADVIVADRRYYRDSGFVPAKFHPKYRAVGVFSPLVVGPDAAAAARTRAELGIGRATLILYVGRLHPHKLAEDLIPFAKALGEHHDNWTFVLAGDGPLRESMEAAAKPLGDRVRFLGNQPPERLADLYRAADVMVATHGGVTLLEAATAGKATIAYAYDWMGEFIRDQENGRLVPVRDVAALAEAVADVLDHPERARIWGEQARRDVTNHHDRTRAIGNERAVYEALLRPNEG